MRPRDWLFALFLIGATFLVYAPAWHGGFVWDDDYYVTNNPLLTAPDGLWRIWFSLDAPSQYFPLVYTTFRIEHALWGLNPTGYHFVNLVLHSLNAVLVWRLLARLKIPGALLAAAIFALHPVQVESVAWITERKNVLMGFFFLLTLGAWIEFLDARSRRRWLFYFLGLLSCLLALSAKTTACTLPAALVLILWLRKERITGARLIQIAPFAVLGLGAGLVTVWWERYHVGTRGEMFAMGWVDRLLVASRAVWFYLRKLFWPNDLTFIYPRWNIDSASPSAYIWLLLGIVAIAAICFLRKFVGRSLEVAGIFFVATLGPMLGFIMLYTFRYTFVADHYQYLACVGPFAFVSAGMINVSAKVKHGAFIANSVGALIVIALMFLTWRQSASYRDVETLWRTTIARNPACWLAHSNLARLLMAAGKEDEAMAHFAKAEEIAPDQPETELNLGSVLLEKGRADEALVHFQKALTKWPNDPDANNDVGAILLQRNQVDEAIKYFQKVLGENPDYARAHNNLGNALLRQGRMDEAIVHYRKTLELPFDHAESHYNLGNALMRKDDVDDAIASYRQAVALQPGHANAHNNLANALEKKQLWPEALLHFEQAAQIAPASVMFNHNVAWFLSTCPDTALRNGERALIFAQLTNELSGGDNPLMLRALAAAYAQSNQFPEAIETAKRALAAVNENENPELAEALQHDLSLYRSGSAFR